MNKLKTITIALFAFMMMYSCEESAREEIEDSLNNNSDTEQVASDDPEEEVVEVAQSVDERIIEIKALYAKIQAAPNKEDKCISKTKTIYEGMEGGYPFENKAKECTLEDNLKYQQVYLNGYEWGETTNFYFKDNTCFFVYLTGGAEACAYDYRVYYDREGEVIRVLSAKNDCDGNEVPSSVEVKNETEKKEILTSVANAKKELTAILKK